MSAGNYDFTLEQGVDCPVVITYTDNDDNPIDLTAYTEGRMVAKANYGDAASYFDITKTGGGLVFGGVAGTIALTGLTDTVTDALTFDTAVFDLVLTDGSGLLDRPVRGIVTLSLEV